MIERYEIVGAPFMGTLEMEHMVGIYDERVPTRGTPTYKHDRKSLRLAHYDYAKAGYYFITITTQNREYLFGQIVDGMMDLNLAGEMVGALWHEIPNDFEHVRLHDFVIMPNHIHGIIEIVKNDKCVGVPLVGTLGTVHNHETVGIFNGYDESTSIMFKSRAPTRDAPTMGDIVGAFKSKTTNTYIKMVKNKTLPPFQKRIWQRNFYEHVIRDDGDYVRIATYIENNPSSWNDDTLNNP